MCLVAGYFAYTNDVTIFDLVCSSSFSEYYKAETFPLTLQSWVTPHTPTINSAADTSFLFSWLTGKQIIPFYLFKKKLI